MKSTIIKFSMHSFLSQGLFAHLNLYSKQKHTNMYCNFLIQNTISTNTLVTGGPWPVAAASYWSISSACDWSPLRYTVNTDAEVDIKFCLFVFKFVLLWLVAIIIMIKYTIHSSLGMGRLCWCVFVSMSVSVSFLSVPLCLYALGHVCLRGIEYLCVSVYMSVWICIFQKGLV